MKIVVSKENLSTGLRKVLNVVSSKTTIPVLNNVLLEAAEGKLALTTTDLEVCIRTQVPAVVEEEGSTTLPAKKFGQIVSVLPNGDVRLESDEGQRVSIRCQKAYFRIEGMEAREFPKDSGFEGNWAFSLPAAEFRRAVGKVSYAVSQEDSRQVLNGILLSLRGGILTVVGTDGRRLALVEKSLASEGAPEGDVILPIKTVSELTKVLPLEESEGEASSVKVDLTESRAAFAVGGTVLTSKLVDGSYPNYRQVVPATFAKSAVIPRETFATVLNRVSMVVSDTSASVKMKLENAMLTLAAASAEVGEGSEPMEVSYEGETVEIAFNPAFLADPLRHLECDQLIFQFNDQFSPVSISGDEGFLYVIMPMRG